MISPAHLSLHSRISLTSCQCASILSLLCVQSGAFDAAKCVFYVDILVLDCHSLTRLFLPEVRSPHLLRHLDIALCSRHACRKRSACASQCAGAELDCGCNLAGRDIGAPDARFALRSCTHDDIAVSGGRGSDDLRLACLYATSQPEKLVHAGFSRLPL